MNHDEIACNNYKDKKSEWFDYVKNDVLCTAFSYACYCKAMQEIIGFSMKDCLSAPGLGWKNSNSMRDENDEPIYTYNDEYMRWFVRQSIKGGRVCAFNQYYKSKIYDEALRIISEELKFEGTVYDQIEAYLKYKKHHEEFIKKEHENKFDEYRDLDEEEKNNYINKKIGEFPIHKLIQELSLNDLFWDFDVVSLYPSAISEEKSIYPRIETGYAFKPNMNEDLVNKFNNQTFTQGSAEIKIKFYNPKELVVQHLPVKERVKK